MMDKDLGKIALTVTLIATALVLIYLFALGSRQEEKFSLPVLSIAGVVGLLITLALISTTFALVGLSDKTQALALPEGSVRAVIALALIVLFAIFAIFLFGNLSSSSQVPLKSLGDLTKDDALALKSSPSFQIALLKSNGSTEPGKERYTLYYTEPRNPASDDFAKQLLVMIGTLVTSVASFYFGAKTAAQSQAPDASRQTPILRSVMQPSAPQARDAKPFNLEIAGENLDLIKEAKLVQGTAQILARGTTSNASVVKCEVTADSTVPAGKWDVVVTDGTGKQAVLAGAVTLS